MPCWLVKSESNRYSIDDLKRDGTTLWHGVRNYQARNYLKSMSCGDLVLFYHSVVAPIGVAGLGKVARVAYPDPTQFDRSSEYFDDKATKEAPRWYCPDIKFVERFASVLETKELRQISGLSKLDLLRPRNRLSVQPVSDEHFKIIVKAARAKSE